MRLTILAATFAALAACEGWESTPPFPDCYPVETVCGRCDQCDSEHTSVLRCDDGEVYELDEQPACNA